MRDSFDHYFTGWNLDPDAPAEAQAEFATLVAAVGAYVISSPAAVETWRVYPLDGKKECFFHFVKAAEDAGALPASTARLVAQLKAAHPRWFV